MIHNSLDCDDDFRSVGVATNSPSQDYTVRSITSHRLFEKPKITLTLRTTKGAFLEKHSEMGILGMALCYLFSLRNR